MKNLIFWKENIELSVTGDTLYQGYHDLHTNTECI